VQTFFQKPLLAIENIKMNMVRMWFSIVCKWMLWSILSCLILVGMEAKAYAIPPEMDFPSRMYYFPRPTTRTAIAVESSTLKIECQIGSSPDEMYCTGLRLIRLHNPTDSSQTVDFKYDSVDAFSLKDPNPQQVQTVTLGPGETTVLRRLVTFYPEKHYQHGFKPLIFMPLEARHPLLSSPRKLTFRVIAHRPGVGRTGLNREPEPFWSAVGPLSITLSYPTALNYVGDLDPKLISENRRELSVTGNETTRFVFKVTRSPLVESGLQIGLGGRTNVESEWRGRVGYDIKLMTYMFGSMNVDTNFKNHVSITPTVDFMTPWLLMVIPWVGIGGGIPIRVAPERTVGLRGQLSAGYYNLGIVFSVDWFPKSAIASDRTQISLLGRVTF
jgi:hypothetical protein